MKEETENKLACSSATAVSYRAGDVRVDLDASAVRSYLVRGNANYVTDQEIALFINTCMERKLNPFVNGEVYLIKYSKDQPAQMVVGKEAFLKRAYENPAYREMKCGVVVVGKDGDVSKKEGTCLYPGEALIGGWCAIYYERGGRLCECYKEVSLAEYSSGKSSWTSKPATMIAKVAISQCARDAFPSDFEGLYTCEEMAASGAIDAKFVSDEISDSGEDVLSVNEQKSLPAENDKTSVEERKKMFAEARRQFGKEAGDSLLKRELEKRGVEKSEDLTRAQYAEIMARLGCAA